MSFYDVVILILKIELLLKILRLSSIASYTRSKQLEKIVKVCIKIDIFIDKNLKQNEITVFKENIFDSKVKIM